LTATPNIDRSAKRGAMFTVTPLTTYRNRLWQCESCLPEERPCEVAMPRHSDLFITFERLSEQCLRSLAIAGRAAIFEHHRLETAYLRPFKKMRYSLGLAQRSLKMSFGGRPPTRRSRGHACDRLRETEDRPERDGSSIREFASQWI
jgi:hypothetical protein